MTAAVPALEALALELAKGLDAALSSPLLAELRAKEAGKPVSTKAALSSISIERHGAGYQAHINGDRRMWGYGDSMYEAIGNAVNAHAADIGVTVEGRAKEAGR